MNNYIHVNMYSTGNYTNYSNHSQLSYYFPNEKSTHQYYPNATMHYLHPSTGSPSSVHSVAFNRSNKWRANELDQYSMNLKSQFAFTQERQTEEHYHNSIPNHRLKSYLELRRPTLVSKVDRQFSISLPKIGRPKKSTLTSSERCKRFRAQKHQQISKLVLDVGLLKCKIAELSHVRDNLTGLSGEIQKKYTTQIVNKCIHMISNFGSFDQRVVKKQMIFLQEVCHENIEHSSLITGNTHGSISELLSSWTQFCKSFSKAETVSNHMNYVNLNTQVLIQATSIVKFQFSKATLRVFFPNALDSQYVQTLCGLEVCATACHKFIFDEENKCISWKTHFDFVSGLAEALGSLASAVDILGQSSLQQTFHHL